jgi:solute carrier family 50 protein (sugar transporter)
MDSLQEGVGWGAACLTVLYHLAPIEPFLRVLRGKLNFEDTPGVFVTTCYVNCFVWYVYGDMIFSDQIKYSYLVASCISLLLMVIYLIYELRKYLVDSILNALIIITGTWAVYRALTIIIDDDRIVGKICIGTTLVVFLTPIQTLYKVIKEKNYILIPFYSSIVYLFASIIWVVYGVMITEFYIVAPNAAGIIISLIQIFIYLNFKRKYPIIGERDISSTIGIETSGIEESKKEEPSVKIDDDKPAKTKEKPVKIVSKTDE